MRFFQPEQQQQQKEKEEGAFVSFSSRLISFFRFPFFFVTLTRRIRLTCSVRNSRSTSHVPSKTFTELWKKKTCISICVSTYNLIKQWKGTGHRLPPAGDQR